MRALRLQWLGAFSLVCEVALRAGLHYGGEVHRPVNKFSPRHGYFEAREGMLKNMKRQ